MNHLKYFNSCPKYFWSFEEQGNVISIPGGSTIGYTDFIFEYIKDLAPQGLPPFGTLLLGITATNESLTDDIKIIENGISKLIELYYQSNESLKRQFEKELSEAVEFMKILNSLPLKYKKGKTRNHLFRVIFDKCHSQLSKVKSNKVLDLIDSNKNYLKYVNQQENFHYIFYNDFRTLGLLTRKFPDVDTLIKKLTEIPFIDKDEIPEELTEPEGTEKSDNPFIDQLLQIPQTFQVAALIKYIWSGISIPFFQNIPGEQPLGGISDLSNKGDFDKLLLSEFANEDIMLMSRLANNEALYLKRESPPETNRKKRILLIDGTLKNWGTPKLINHAITIALANHPKNNLQYSSYIIGEGYKEFLFSDPTEIIDGLYQLDPLLHMGEGLQLFFKENPLHKDDEIFLLTNKDSVKFPSIQKVINDNYKFFKYSIYAEADGGIEVYKHQSGSKKLVSEITLPLEKAWVNPPGKSEKKKKEITTEVAGEEVPILYPRNDAKKMVTMDGTKDLYVISREGDLFLGKLIENNGYLMLENFGMKLIRSKLPRGTNDYAIGKNVYGNPVLLLYKHNTKEIVLYNLTDGRVNSFFFGETYVSQRNSFFYTNTAFYFLLGSHYWKIELESEPSISKHTDINELWKLKNIQNSILNEQKDKKVNYYAGNYLKNITSVHINTKHNLVLNYKHELILSASGTVFFSIVNNESRGSISVAVKSSGNTWTFPNGNTVIVQPNGMLILKKAIEDSSSFFDLHLKKTGSHKLEVLKLIKEYSDLPLAQCKTIADHQTGIIKSGIYKSEALKIQNIFEEKGTFTDIVPSRNQDDIYIPTVLESSLGMATEVYFAGNSFYCPQNSSLSIIDSKVFFENQIKDFIMSSISKS